ncbi:MAG: hypothetical protein HY289_02865 [Planctomycetes bacterium]|nr:hypothetical protein [Planctomycetota bacterium]
MRRWAYLLGLLLAATPAALAQPAPLEPPIADRPVDFSHIIGKYQRPEQKATTPTEVHVEDPITVKITITGVGPEKGEPSRKHLHPLFENTWKDDFYVQEMRDEHEVDRAKRRWTFVYRLKPKHTGIETIVGFKLRYYDPSIGGEMKFPSHFARHIKITVKPKPDQSETFQTDVLAAPDSFYAPSPASEVLSTPAPAIVPAIPLVLLLVLPPLVCLFGALAWRRLFPDTASLAIKHRRGAAQRALAQVQAPDARVREIVCRYLTERFDFAVADPTPAEAHGFLKRRGFTISNCDRVRAFLQACDAARYTEGPATPAHAAAPLIEALEADPCVRD